MPNSYDHYGDFDGCGGTISIGIPHLATREAYAAYRDDHIASHTAPASYETWASILRQTFLDDLADKVAAVLGEIGDDYLPTLVENAENFPYPGYRMIVDGIFEVGIRAQANEVIVGVVRASHVLREFISQSEAVEGGCLERTGMTIRDLLRSNATAVDRLMTVLIQSLVRDGYRIRFCSALSTVRTTKDAAFDLKQELGRYRACFQTGGRPSTLELPICLDR